MTDPPAEVALLYASRGLSIAEQNLASAQNDWAKAEERRRIAYEEYNDAARAWVATVAKYSRERA